MGIRAPKIERSFNGVVLGESRDSDSDINYPVFCLKYIHNSYNLDLCSKCDQSFSKGFLRKLHRISQLTWTDIQFGDRKKNGSEKIARQSIRIPIPNSITNDVKDFLSFYFNSDRGRIIGYRSKGNVFNIVFVDTKLEVYKH